MNMGTGRTMSFMKVSDDSELRLQSSNRDLDLSWKKFMRPQTAADNYDYLTGRFKIPPRGFVEKYTTTGPCVHAQDVTSCVSSVCNNIQGFSYLFPTGLQVVGNVCYPRPQSSKEDEQCCEPSKDKCP